jgi:hypothetical protein
MGTDQSSRQPDLFSAAGQALFQEPPPADFIARIRGELTDPLARAREAQALPWQGSDRGDACRAAFQLDRRLAAGGRGERVARRLSVRDEPSLRNRRRGRSSIGRVQRGRWITELPCTTVLTRFAGLDNSGATTCRPCSDRNEEPMRLVVVEKDRRPVSRASPSLDQDRSA